MLAIPVESDTQEPMSTKLFGNAKYFALIDETTKDVNVVENEGCGNGIKTATFLIDKGVTKAYYGFLGDGPFHVMLRGGIDVYFLGKETMSLSHAITTASEGNLIRVTAENAQTYLDPGTNAGACECGCSHD
ncbi:MAG: NifB/NifX family molybdenum-iron cluster-binding protein [Sulfuricurvum sp.]